MLRRVRLYQRLILSESDIASIWAHRETNFKFTLSSYEDQRTKNSLSHAFAQCKWTLRCTCRIGLRCAAIRARVRRGCAAGALRGMECWARSAVPTATRSAAQSDMASCRSSLSFCCPVQSLLNFNKNSILLYCLSFNIAPLIWLLLVFTVLSPCRPVILFHGETYRTTTSYEAISYANRKIKLILYYFLCQFIKVLFFSSTIYTF